MDFQEIYHFIFETYTGIGVSVLVCLVLCILLAAILEKRTRRKIRDRATEEDLIEFNQEDEDD